jgi:hypothetical protein
MLTVSVQSCVCDHSDESGEQGVFHNVETSRPLANAGTILSRSGKVLSPGGYSTVSFEISQANIGISKSGITNCGNRAGHF